MSLYFIDRGFNLLRIFLNFSCLWNILRMYLLMYLFLALSPTIFEFFMGVNYVYFSSM